MVQSLLRCATWLCYYLEKAVKSRLALISFALIAGAVETVGEHISPKAAGVLREYCIDCHDSVSAEAGLDLEKLSQRNFLEHRHLGKSNSACAHSANAPTGKKATG
jgi:hypothetical protein